MISFLYPWFLAGLVAVGAPIWLHLRRKDREKVVPFTGLRFLEDQPIARQPPLHLKNVLLFLLRMLALLLFVAAFARPYFQQNGDVATSSRVFVLDNTLSRQAGDGLAHDKSTILAEIDRATSREQIGVIALGRQPRVIVNFGNSPAQAKEKVEALQPTAERGTILSAIRQADFLLKQSIGEEKRIVVLSDFQKNQWTENSNAPPFLEPGRIKLASFPSVDKRPNFYVAEPKVQAVFLGDAEVVQFTALIGRTGDVSSADVLLTANGREILHRPLELDAKTDKISIITQFPTDPQSWLQGSITITAKPDDLPQDNTVYFSVPPIVEGRIALLSQSIYLHAALSDPVAHGHWQVQDLQPTRLQEALNAPPDSVADILMIDGAYLQSAPARQLAKRYLQTGHGVFIMVDQLTVLLTGFLEELGFDPQTRLTSSVPPPLAPIRYFSSESPIFKPFLAPDASNILEVRMGEPVNLSAREAKPILFAQDGDPLLFDGTKDNGRYLLSTFAFDRRQTDWVIHPSFVPFLDSALQYLRPQSPLNATLEPGEIWLVQIPANLDVKTVVLFANDKEVERIAVNANHRALLHVPGQPGLYGLAYDKDPAIRQMLAVNPSEKESDLTYFRTDPDILKAWTLGPPDKSKQPTTASIAAPPTTAAAANIWWLLVLSGLAALFFEMIVLHWRGQA